MTVMMMMMTMLSAGDGAAYPVPEDPCGRDGGHVLPHLQEENRREVSTGRFISPFQHPSHASSVTHETTGMHTRPSLVELSHEIAGMHTDPSLIKLSRKTAGMHTGPSLVELSRKTAGKHTHETLVKLFHP